MNMDVKNLALQISRWFLGGLCLVAGLNGLSNSIGLSTILPRIDVIEPFMATIAHSSILYLIIKISFLAVGILLIVKMYVPFGLVFLIPVSLHILTNHAFINASGLPIGLAIVLTHAYLMYVYKANYKKIFEKNPAI